MSDDIPFDIQTEIISRLSLESLIRVRLVSKQWKSLIDSSEFNTNFTVRQAQKHLLLRYRDVDDYKQKYVLIDDDDTFTRQKLISSIVPKSLGQILVRYVCGSSQGLYYFFPMFPPIEKIVIWNPSIRKSVDIFVPNGKSRVCELSNVGVGVCPRTLDPKIVKINRSKFSSKFEDLSCCQWRVEVFTLSSGTWRSPLSNLPNKALGRIRSIPKVVNRFIYWFADEAIDWNSKNNFRVIISFDLTSEEFKTIYIPDKLARYTKYKIFPLYELRETLAALHNKKKADKQLFKVWVLENGVSKSFTKLFTISLPHASVRKVLGFSKNGQFIMATRYDGNIEEEDILEAYDPPSKQIKDLGIYGVCSDFFLSSYTESLLLLNQPNTLIGDKHDGHNARCGSWKIKVVLYLVPILICLWLLIVFYV